MVLGERSGIECLRFVHRLPDAEKHRLTEPIVLRPFRKFHLTNHLTFHGIVGRRSTSSPAMKSSRSCWAVDRSTWIERRDYALLLTMLRDLRGSMMTELRDQDLRETV